MYFPKIENKVSSNEIARFVGGKIISKEEIFINGFSSFINSKIGTITFVKNNNNLSNNYENYQGMIVLAPYGSPNIDGVCVIEVKNPRLAFSSVVENFFTGKPVSNISKSAMIDATAHIAENCIIGPNSVVGENVLIGEGTIIRANVVIGPNVKIGKSCLIKSFSVIGEEGFGIEKDENGENIRIPHHGSVNIGDYVEVGCFTTICSGTIDCTIVMNNVKIDDHVHISHNCFIGDNSIITACAEISGSVKIGKGVWVAPNASITNSISICDGSFIGIGSVVTKSVKEPGVFFGSPAKMIRKFAK